MKSRLFAAFACALGLLFAASASHATGSILLTRIQLVGGADRVVRATVGDPTYIASPDGRVVHTRTPLHITGYAKGSGPSDLVLEQYGGKLGELTVAIAGDAKLTPGEDVVLFLRSSADVVHLTELAQSVYHIDNALAVRDLSELSFFTRLTGKLVTVPTPVESPEPVLHLWADLLRLSTGTH